MRIALALFAAILCWSSSLICAAQSSQNGMQPRAALPTPQPASEASTAAPVSALLQPSLDTVRSTLTSVHVEKWKKGSVRDEATQNISQILHDLQANMPPLLQDADVAPGSIGKSLPLSRHVNALYDVLLRVVEASRVAGPDDQAEQLQRALLSLGNARLALADHMQASADTLEKQVVDLRANIQAEQARRLATPAPVALPCIPPPTHRVVRKTAKAPAKPTPKPSTTPPSNGIVPKTTQPAGSHS
jgi:cell division septation protein DedD